jgi:magnesium chelatase family protein
MDLAQVRGQEAGKRALEVAAAGGHAVALVGPGGAGKSMLARCLPGILPSGAARPVRAPHYGVTAKALRGELALGADGTLILDDLPLLRLATLRALSEALDHGVAAQVVATMRPCPCGHLGDRLRECACTAGTIRRHRARAAPVLDRLDLIVAVPALTVGELRARPGGCSSRVAARVAAAREIQTSRGGQNAAMVPAEIQAHCPLDNPARQLLDTAFERLALSAAALHRVLRVARTLADLAGAERLGRRPRGRGGAVPGGGVVTGRGEGLGGPGARRPQVGLPLGRVRPLAALPETVGGGP